METNRKLQAENDHMRPIVNFVTVAQYVSRDNHYPSRGNGQSLASGQRSWHGNEGSSLISSTRPWLM